MTLRHTLIALPLLALAACGPAKKDEAPASAPAPEAAKTKTPATLAVTPYTGGTLKITKDSVGPITAATAFDIPTIQALFPKAKVEQAFIHFGQGPALPIINVEQDNVPLLEIGKGEEGAIGYIAAASDPVTGPRDEKLLAKWGELDFAVAQCRAGEGREVNMTICVRPDAPTVSYVFGVPGFTGKTVPPEAMLKAKGQLNQFIWRPTEGAVVGAG